MSKADRLVTLRIERSSFPNQIGVEQKRVLTFVTPDDLKVGNTRNRQAGGRNDIMWKRAK